MGTDMTYRQLGNCGLRVSAIGLGSYLTIGMSIDHDGSQQTVRAAIEAGINFFDTANAYNNGQAELELGRCLRDQPRSSLVIATKVFSKMGDGPNDRGLSAKHIFEQCDQSLRRLGVDYIDLYQCHRPDKSVRVEEVVRAMEDLARRGKILYWGTSEWPAWLIARAVDVAAANGARPPVSNQPRYSLLYRTPEAELFQYCRQDGIGNVVFSALAHGLLTGKYDPDAPPPPGTRAADPKQNAVIRNMYWSQENLTRARKLKSIAQELGHSASQLALAWTLRRTEVSSAIIGATRVEQIQDNVQAARIKIPEEVLTRLDELFPGPSESYPLS